MQKTHVERCNNPGADGTLAPSMTVTDMNTVVNRRLSRHKGARESQLACLTPVYGAGVSCQSTARGQSRRTRHTIQIFIPRRYGNTYPFWSTDLPTERRQRRTDWKRARACGQEARERRVSKPTSKRALGVLGVLSLKGEEGEKRLLESHNWKWKPRNKIQRKMGKRRTPLPRSTCPCTNIPSTASRSNFM